MNELEKILRQSIGKTVSIRYMVTQEGTEHIITGKLISVTDEVITISAVMRHHINRKPTVLIGLDVKE